MKNQIKNRILLPALCIIIVAMFNGCSKWTENESLTIVQANIADQNPELYAQYLASLKTYKKSDHKIVYAWFDNSKKIAMTRAQHLSSVPDSIDIVVMMYPDSLCEREINEMNSIRDEKGTKVIYNISYPDIEKRYNVTVATELDIAKAANAKDASVIIESATQKAGFTVYLAAYLDKTLLLADKYSYEGLSVRYDSKNIVYMETVAKEQYLINQAAFFAKVTSWLNTHSNKILVFEGKPQYLIDKTILPLCKFIVLPMSDVTSANDLTYNVRVAMENGVPSNHFIVTVSTFSLDQTDVKTGYFINYANNSVSAITEAANWVATPEADFTKAGLGIYNVQNDYYNTNTTYKHTREAIGTMNPSPKN